VRGTTPIPPIKLLAEELVKKLDVIMGKVFPVVQKEAAFLFGQRVIIQLPSSVNPDINTSSKVRHFGSLPSSSSVPKALSSFQL